MLFGKKRIQQIKEAVYNAMDETLSRQALKQSSQQEKQNNQICENIEKNRKAIRNLSDTVEDFLDMLQEQNNETNQYQLEMKKNAEYEQRLVGLVGLYHEQMELLDQWINGQGTDNETAQQAWKQQYKILKGQVTAESKFCAIEYIGTVGELVDYRLHEVLQAFEPESTQQEGTVATIFSSGMIYKGKVVKKARVAAYKKGN